MKKTFHKISLLFFLFLILFLPTQLGKHFWPNFSLVLGIRVDYLSPTIFLSDLLILATLFSWTLSFFPFKKLKFNFLGNPLFWLFVAFYMVNFINIFFSTNPAISTIKFFRLLEFGFLSFFIYREFVRQIGQIKVVNLLAFLVLFQSLLAFGQFWQQKSLGLWILGERDFNLATPGIAVFDLSGARFLRPYGTFPHPNVLAAFLALSSPFLLSSLLSPKNKRWERLFLISSFLFLIVALFFTFSRTGWLVFLFSSVFLLFYPPFFKNTLRKLGKKYLYLFLFLLPLFLGLFFFLAPVVYDRFITLRTTDVHSLSLRGRLNEASLSMFWQRPILGVGLGNYVAQLPNFYQAYEIPRILQPAHNVFLLVLAETGILGLLTFILILIYPFKRLFLQIKKKRFEAFLILILFSQALFLFFIDHYFWTLQQGNLILSFLLAFLYRRSF